MTLILYATYATPRAGEAAFGALLEQGIPADDLTLVMLADESPRAAEVHAKQGVDAGMAIVEDVRSDPGRLQEEHIADIESSIGGGIATVTPDDAVSAPQEMDDAPDVAENIVEPLNERSYGYEDLKDAKRFADKGTIDATRPPITGIEPEPRTPRGERPYTVEVLNGVAILGDGPLATEMLAAELAEESRRPTLVLHECLERLGCGAAEIRKLETALSEGGAVLAVTEAPGRLSIDDIERLVESSGGQNLHAYALAE